MKLFVELGADVTLANGLAGIERRNRNASRMFDFPAAGSCGQVRRRRERRSGGATFVVVMQTADVWDLHDRAAGWRVGSPRDGSILVQREVRAPLVIVREVAL